MEIVTKEDLEMLDWLDEHSYVNLETDTLEPNDNLTDEEMEIFKMYHKKLEEEKRIRKETGEY